MIEYLPLGSVVLLKNADKDAAIKLVIVGRRQKVVGSDTEYDYAGFVYPIGSVNQQFQLFNHADIEEVVFTGYTDELETSFVEYLNTH